MLSWVRVIECGGGGASTAAPLRTCSLQHHTNRPLSVLGAIALETDFAHHPFSRSGMGSVCSGITLPLNVALLCCCLPLAIISTPLAIVVRLCER